MNYYPSYYMNNNNTYPYGNNSNQYIPQTQTYMPQPQPQQQQMLPQYLNGKVVDSADVVRATEVPIGGYGIFPKADLSEIYIKSWNNNGTTSIITFKPQPIEATEAQPADVTNTTIMEILNKVNTLETKIDSLNVLNSNTAIAASKPSIAPKKEIKVNEY